MSTWEFVCNWYRDNECEDFLDRQRRGLVDARNRVPEDIYSKEFADWLVNQYRLAMAKGIYLARNDSRLTSPEGVDHTASGNVTRTNASQ